MKKEAFSSNKAFIPKDTFTQVVKYGDIAFISGQCATDNITGEFLGGTVKEQTEIILRNIAGILNDMGLDLNAVLMMRCYISSIEKISEMNEVYNEHFRNVRVLPARCTVEAKMGKFDVEMYAIVGIEEGKR